MTKQKFLVTMIYLNAVLLLFNAFYTHDKAAVVINLIGCVMSWLAINMLDRSEHPQLEDKKE